MNLSLSQDGPLFGGIVPNVHEQYILPRSPSLSPIVMLNSYEIYEISLSDSL